MIRNNSVMNESRTASLVVWMVPVVSTAMLVAGLVLHARTAALDRAAYPLYLADVWVAVIMVPLGAWLYSRGAPRGMVTVLLLQGSLSVCGFTGELAAYDVASDGTLSGVGAAAAWISTFTWAPYLLLLTWLPLLWPDGHLPPRWGHALLGVVLSLLGIAAVAAALRPGPVADRPGVVNPLGVDSTVLTAVGEACLAFVVLVMMPLCVGTAVARAVRRHEGTSVAVAFVVLAAAVLTQSLLAYPWNDIVVAAAFTLVAGALVAAEQRAGLLRAWRADAQRATRVRDEERRRVRLDLHDGLGPELAGISLGLTAVSLDVDDSRVRAELTQLRDDLGNAVSEVRRIVDGLRPATLAERGLVGALESRAERLAAAGFTVELDLRLDGVSLEPETEVAAFRVADEALSNAVRHSGADTLTVRGHVVGREVIVEIADDGNGQVRQAAEGLGLQSMHARARSVGAVLTLQSDPAAGTRVRFVVPVTRAPTAAGAGPS